MSCRVSHVAFSLLFTCVSSAVLKAEEAKSLPIIALAQESSRAGNIGPVQLAELSTAVIRNSEELVARSERAESAKDTAVQKELAAELAKVLGIEAIDWSKQMVLAARGEPGTKADKVAFDSLQVQDKVLTVAWKVIPRPPHAGPGTPIALVLVERFDGDVKFVAAGSN